jgi:hypothetical protein
MPLPLPNLDDKNFNALVDEATRTIPRYNSEWTDHNRHDPGIAFIELFAWLTEMQQYYLNQISDANYLKFLKLLGQKPAHASPARTDVTFYTSTTARQIVPRGTKLLAGDVVFETERRLHVIPARLNRVITSSRSGLKDNTDANNITGLVFSAFGEEAETGSRLYLGFDKLFVVNWNNVPGTESESLLAYLSDVRMISWAKKATIEKTNGDKTLRISGGGDSLHINLSDDKQQASLEVNGHAAAGFFVKQEGAALNLYDQPFPALETFSITFNLFEGYPVARGQHGDEQPLNIPSALVTWDYHNADGQWSPLELIAELEPIIAAKTRGASLDASVCQTSRNDLLNAVKSTSSFKQLSRDAQDYLIGALNKARKTTCLKALLNDPKLLLLKRDETLMFSESGSVYFTAPSDMKPRMLHPFKDDLYWLRATVKERGYELPPRIDAIIVNTTAAVERYTSSEYVEFSGTGLPGQSFIAQSYLALRGEQIVQARERDGRWIDWERVNDFSGSGPDDAHFTIITDDARAVAEIKFGDGLKGKIPAEDNSNIRLISYLPEFFEQRLIGRSNGLPGQVFTLDRVPIAPEDFALQVEETFSEEGVSKTMWRDWVRLADLDASRPGDFHYALRPETGEVVFGDGINGDIPSTSDEGTRNIRIISYKTEGGEAGNVARGVINRIALPYNVEQLRGLDSLKVENLLAASGGAAKESLEAAQVRVRRDLKTPHQGVTSDDIEYLARSTPGLRVERAIAIPLFEPGLKNYPQNQAPASVTVVVLPFSFSPRPVPSPAFLLNVCRHLDKHRLITTRLYVVAPDYVRVSAQATVMLVAGFDAVSMRQEIQRRLNNFLRPLPAEDDPNGAGWPFGRAVFRSEIYQLIENITGVDCVEKVALFAEGVGIKRDAEGNILIPPESLVFSGDHEIEILTPQPECRVKGGTR